MDSTNAESRPVSWSLRWTAATLLSAVPLILTLIFGPKSGAEELVVLFPWVGMLLAHLLFAPLALGAAWHEGRRWLVALLALYPIAFVGFHLILVARANDVPQKLEWAWLRRARSADYELLQLPRLLLSLHTMIPSQKHVPLLLVELGADVNVHGKEGRTPLMLATQNSHHEFMEALIRAGADLAAVDEAGRTALHQAAETRFEAEQVLARLLDAGAPIEALDAEGRTPLCVAQATGNERIAAALEARGALPQSCAVPLRPRRVLIRPPGNPR